MAAFLPDLSIAQYGDGLAPELGDGDANVGMAQIALEAVFDPDFKLLGSESAGLDPADQREADSAAQIDANRLAGDFLHVGSLDSDLILRPEYVAGLLRGQRNRQQAIQDVSHVLSFL